MTFTKSWLQHQIAEFESCAERTDGYRLDDGGKNTLAALKLALAGMETEPVGITDKSEIECLKRGEMANVMPPDYKGCDVGDSVCLYDTPQPLTTSERAELENYRNAQQVVPGDITGPLAHAYKELTPHFMRNHISVFERYGIYPDGSAGIQAMRIALHNMERRAAMRQGADGNAPVAPDGWVACSERMPDETNDPDGGATCYLVLYAEGRQPNGGSNVQVSNVTYLRRWHDGMITHWMPLPAAPQQEAE